MALDTNIFLHHLNIVSDLVEVGHDVVLTLPVEVELRNIWRGRAFFGAIKSWKSKGYCPHSCESSVSDTLSKAFQDMVPDYRVKELKRIFNQKGQSKAWAELESVVKEGQKGDLLWLAKFKVVSGLSPSETLWTASHDLFTRAISEYLISPKDAAVVASLHWHPKVTAFVSADSDMKRAAQLGLLPDWVQGYKEEYR